MLAELIPDSGEFLPGYIPRQAAPTEFPPDNIRVRFQFGAYGNDRAKPFQQVTWFIGRCGERLKRTKFTSAQLIGCERCAICDHSNKMQAGVSFALGYVAGQFTLCISLLAPQIRLELEQRSSQEGVYPPVHLRHLALKVKLSAPGPKPVDKQFVNQCSHFLMLRTRSQLGDDVS
jgi:hypothetical protein